MNSDLTNTENMLHANTMPFIQKKHRKVLVFDVETTGLIPKKDPVTKQQPTISQFPYVIQLSFIVYNAIDSNIEKTYNAYIKAPIPISEEITKITGITQDICDTKGIDIVNALVEFYNAYVSCDCVVAHNISFDSRLIVTEIERNYKHLEPRVPNILNLFNPMFNRLKQIDIYCTMQESIHICNIMIDSPNDPTKKYKKFPKLQELYYTLFRYYPENLHNSIIDTLVCLRCFLRIKLHQEFHTDKFNYWMKRLLEE